jgi:hypothetical protein
MRDPQDAPAHPTERERPEHHTARSPTGSDGHQRRRLADTASGAKIFRIAARSTIAATNFSPPPQAAQRQNVEPESTTLELSPPPTLLPRQIRSGGAVLGHPRNALQSYDRRRSAASR